MQWKLLSFWKENCGIMIVPKTETNCLLKNSVCVWLDREAYCVCVSVSVVREGGGREGGREEY